MNIQQQNYQLRIQLTLDTGSSANQNHPQPPVQHQNLPQNGTILADTKATTSSNNTELAFLARSRCSLLQYKILLLAIFNSSPSSFAISWTAEETPIKVDLLVHLRSLASCHVDISVSRPSYRNVWCVINNALKTVSTFLPSAKS